MYAFITDLPPQVRGVLDVSLQTVFLQAYQNAMSIAPDEASAYQQAWQKVFATAFPGEVQSQQLPSMAPPVLSMPATNVVPPQTMPTPIAAHEFGYWVDMSKVALDDFDSGTWIQAMPLGTYQHPVHGEITITQDKVQQFAANVKSRVRGQDLDIDYDHKEKDGKAAGWVQDAQARPDGLYLNIKWTPDAQKALSNKEYRYFSPEYVDSWTHPVSQQKHQNVLFGGALTNRPFLKGILPINLSEVLTHPQGTKGGKPVLSDAMKAIAKSLGLPEDSSEEALAGALTLKLQQPPPAGTPAAPGGDPTSPPAVTPPAVPVAATEPDPELKKLAEANPLIAKMLADQEASNKRLAELETANKLSETRLKLSELDNLKFLVPPTVKEELQKVLLGEVPVSGVLDVIKKLGDVGLVERGERGHQGVHTTDTDNPVKQFSEAVDAVRKLDEKLDYADAVALVSSQQPELFEAYRQASFANEGSRR